MGALGRMKTRSDKNDNRVSITDYLDNVLLLDIIRILSQLVKFDIF